MFFCLYSRNLRRWKWLGFCYSQTPWLWSNQVMFFPLMVITKSNKGLLCLGYMLESCQPIPQLSTVISGGGTQALFKVPRATLLYSQRRNHCSHVYEMLALGRDSAKQFQHVFRLVSRNLLAILSLWPAGPVSVAPPKLSGLTVFPLTLLQTLWSSVYPNAGSWVKASPHTSPVPRRRSSTWSRALLQCTATCSLQVSVQIPPPPVGLPHHLPITSLPSLFLIIPSGSSKLPLRKIILFIYTCVYCLYIPL